MVVKCIKGNLFEVSGKNVGDSRRTKLLVLSKTSSGARNRAKKTLGLRNAIGIKVKVLQRNKLICR